MMVHHQSEYELLTEFGEFADFEGLVVQRKHAINIQFSDGSDLTATACHRLHDGLDWVEVGGLVVGDELTREDGSVIAVTSLTPVGEIEVFDPLNVDGTHSYYTNGVLSHNCDHLYLDEFAHIDRNKQEPFYTSTYPVVTSGADTKITITSTPKGLELFYKIWSDATQLADGTKIDTLKNVGTVGINGFVASESHWSEVPGRDDAWKEMTLSQMSEEQFNQEFENHFIGSSGTLIAGHVLRRLVHQKPIRENDSLRVFKGAEQDHVYIALVDVARGMGLDYNTCVVVDSTQIPYRVVCTYRNNLQSTLQFPSVVAGIAKEYNDAFVLVETNDIGQQVADALHFDLDSENVLMTTTNGRKGTSISGGFGGNVRRGLKMSAAVKRIGCAQLKNLIELDKLVVSDINILQELFTFVETGTSYAAEVGSHDDLVMPLVMFGWLANQRYFKDLTNSDIREHVAREEAANVEADLMPFGFIRGGYQEEISHTERLFGEAPAFF